MDADAIVVGGGLAGLVAACGADRGRQARDPARPGARRSRWAARPSGRSAACSSSTAPSSGACASATATSSRCRTGWARPASTARRTCWPRKWAEAYVAFAAGEKRAWLHARGVRWFPIVGWAERGGYLATEHGNSVPRFHVTWGTGPGIIAPFVRARARGREAGARVAALPPSRQRLHHHGRRGRRRARRHPGAERGRARRTPARARWSAISS